MAYPEAWKRILEDLSDHSSDDEQPAIPGGGFSADFFDSLGPGIPRPSSFPKASEVKKAARQRSSDIFKKFEQVEEILQRHEALIRKRWLKKTPEQRRKLFKAVWPDIPSAHCPDLTVITSVPHGQRGDAKYTKSFMWPFINLEDLAYSKTFLLLLNTRGRNSPCAFAHADWEKMRLGNVSVAIRTVFLNEHIMLSSGQSTPETYGRIIKWDDNDRAFDWLTSGYGVHPGHGLKVLEMQQGIMDFLLACCHQLFHDKPPDFRNDAPV